MNSVADVSFWNAYKRLPSKVRAEVLKAFLLWMADPFHPSLHFKCMDREENIWSARVTRGYRALGVLEGNTVTWYWVGHHDAYVRRLA